MTPTDQERADILGFLTSRKALRQHNRPHAYHDDLPIDDTAMLDELELLELDRLHPQDRERLLAPFTERL